MSTETARKGCLTYVPVPNLGFGWVQACVSILEGFPKELLPATLVLPRSFREIAPSVRVLEAIPPFVPYRYASKIVRPAVDYRFKRALAAADPRTTILYFWPSPPLEMLREVRERGFLTVREMLNTLKGSAKAILDDAYDRLGLPPSHTITEEAIQQEREELDMYDYILSCNARIDQSLIKAGIDKGNIFRTYFGWSPSQFQKTAPETGNKTFRALFIGTVGVRKGVPQLLAAWRKSEVAGELLIVGGVEDAIKPLIAPFLDSKDTRFIEFTYDLETLYKSADIFVLPSIEEGDPQVTYQAAARGLPVIATPMGAGNIIKDGINGLVVLPHDVHGLAAAISTLAKSPELRQRLGSQAANDAMNYTYSIVGAKRASILNNILAES